MTAIGPQRTISLVLRLLPGPAAEGRLVGQVEIIETGELTAVHTAGELAELARRLTQPIPSGANGSPASPG